MTERNQIDRANKNKMVSIVILVHNAAAYARHTLISLKKTTGSIPYEVIVLDNASKGKTRRMLVRMQKSGYIDKLIFMNENTLFSKGNNIAVRLCSSESQYILLLNSDVEIRNTRWLELMMNQHTRGVTALGCSCLDDNRPDGFCYLVDKDLYQQNYLNENYAWFFSLAVLTSDILKDNGAVNTIDNYENFLYHYGGKSGRVRNAPGMNTESSEVTKWFEGRKCNLVHSLTTDPAFDCYNRYSPINLKANFKLKIKPTRKKIKKFVMNHETLRKVFMYVRR